MKMTNEKSYEMKENDSDGDENEDEDRRDSNQREQVGRRQRQKGSSSHLPIHLCHRHRHRGPPQLWHGRSWHEYHATDVRYCHYSGHLWHAHL